MNELSKFTVDWLGECPCCGCSEHEISPNCGDSTDEWLASGDDVECTKCGLNGVIDADGENAWCDWCEDEDVS